MSEYKYCKKCKDYHWTSIECAPAFNIFHPDYLGDKPMVIHGDNHYDAAMKYAEYYNTGNDYCLMDNSIDVTVERDGVQKTFKISAEPSVDYSAIEL